ncbi:MAG: delta-aminolevulinic acid dehydratase [Planctomycetota bacterium]
MGFPTVRMRRLRRTDGLRRMVRETTLHTDDLIAPLFIGEGEGQRKEIESMPGVYRFSLDTVVEEAKLLQRLGIAGLLVFGVPNADDKDAEGTQAWASDGIVQRALKALREACPGMVLIADACFCEYTDHGHCGVLNRKKEVQNDKTLEHLELVALSQARAGADIIAPSGMMDGMVQAIRTALDENGYPEIAILSYSTKFSSAFYGPFREAAESTPQFGNRKQYQMESGNAREAIRESLLDAGEGADMLMVKPALAYLDIIRRIREQSDLPLVAYNVSGEYSMVKAAARKGWIDEKAAAIEILHGIKRAGADLIITYWAKDMAGWLKDEHAPLPEKAAPSKDEH